MNIINMKFNITLISSLLKANDELSFKKGEHLKILSTKEDDNWWKARNKNGRVGLIPGNYVTKVVYLN